MLKKIKRAFTLLELVLVIVIIGIVGLIATEIISNVYTAYLISQRVNELESKSEYFLEQISNRLQYRIKDSTIARRVSDKNYTKLASTTPDANETYILEWIAYSYETLNGSFDGTRGLYVPGYSGLIDVDNPDTNVTNGFFTPGSSLLDIAENIISDLSDGSISLTPSNDNEIAAIFFATVRPDVREYWDDAAFVDSNTSFAISATDNEYLDLYDVGARSAIDIYERYYLAWSAYAIVPVTNPNGTISLFLHYDYQPWQDENYTQAAKKSLLMENVTSFRLEAIDNFIRLKVCVDDANTTGGAFNVQKNSKSAFGFCKEKAIF